MKENIVHRMYNYPISQVFGPSLPHHIANSTYEDALRDLLSKSGLSKPDPSLTLEMAYQVFYEHLKSHYRCEYVYMNEIAHQLLLAFHQDQSAVLLKELTSQDCIADLVIANSQTSVYEIKTELDGFERLPKQINAYRGVFDQIFIVTYQKAVDRIVAMIGDDVGVMVLDENCVLQNVREAKFVGDQFIPKDAVFTLRQSEIMSGYRKYVGELPPIGTALIYDFCAEWFTSLPQEMARKIFSESLKSRKLSSLHFSLVGQCHSSLTMALIGKPLTKRLCHQIMEKFGKFDS